MNSPADEQQSVEAAIAQAAALVRAGRREEALAVVDAAALAHPGAAGLRINRGSLLHSLGRLEAALLAYEEVLALDAAQPFARVGRAVVLADLGRHAQAASAIQLALASVPGSVPVLERAVPTFVRLGRYADALAASDALLQQRAPDAAALALRADVLKALRRPDEAAQCMEAVVRMKPGYPKAAGNLLRTRALCADWRDYELLVSHVRAQVRAGADADQPFTFLAVSDDPAEQLACARLATREFSPGRPMPARAPQGPRLRIGYLCADYDNHASMHLLAGVLEKHDRMRFDVIGLSLGPLSTHPMRARSEAALETFVDLHGRDDAEVTAMVRQLQLDVLVDLNGFTNGARPGVLAQRVAPVQAGYLGYPGTLGGGLLDYLVADAVVVPAHERQHYAEAIAYLPGCYQANDSSRFAPLPPSRTEAGLPRQGFVYACFNHTYKINPPVFASWMRILRAVPGSVLWLLEDNAAATRNLRAHAAAHGVDGDRLVFAPRIEAGAHLARHACADLVLDTLPYNAHTTASDALWMGVPVLTHPGRAFAARVAASLLQSLGLPELVCSDTPGYEARAIALAKEPGSLATLRARLAAARHRPGGPFDTSATARALESAYAAMHERHRRGEAPADFTVGTA